MAEDNQVFSGEMAEDNHFPIKWSEDDKFMDLIESIFDHISTFEYKIHPKTSIYKVPSKLAVRDVNIPHFVSIGPIHAGVADLLAMEEIKLWYSMFFFYRSKDPAGFVQKCGEAIANLQKLAREYYAHDLKKFDKYKLMKILLVDGCFLLELFLRHSNERDYNILKEDEIDNDKYTEIKTISDDLILGNPWMHRAVCQDLALLENQIPLVVLETLLSKVETYLKSNNYGVQDYTLRFFSSDLHARMETSICIDGENPRPSEEPRPSIELRSREELRPSEEPRPRHILELLHKGLLPSWTLQNGEKKYGLLYGATKLLESGVNIKKKFDLSNENDNFNSNLLEIEFDRSKGILKVPQFWFGGTTSLMTKNLVTFEQCSFGKSQSHHVTAYVMFMKCLITSEHDLKLLKRKGIIKTHPGSNSNESLMKFFNDCSEGVALKDFYFSNLCKEVEENSKNWMHFHSYVTCFKSRRRKYGAKLAGQYCPDACRTIAFSAATVLLLLACLQAFYTVYRYYHK